MQKKIVVSSLIVVLLLAVTGKSWSVWNEQGSAAKGNPGQSSPDKVTGGKDAKKSGKPIAVALAKARTDNVREYQNALGSVTSFATVSVKSRVGGQLIKVNFKEGQLVKQGEVLAEIDARSLQAQLAQAQGQQLRNKALLEHAIADLERYRVLRDQDSIATQQVDAQESLVQQYKGTLQADAGAVDNIRLQLSFTKVTAPISGRIGFRQIDTGNNITTTDTLAVINQVSPIAVTFTLPEDKVNEIYHKFNQKNFKGFVVEAWDKGSRRLLAEGKLLTLDNQIDPATGTIKLKAEFRNADGRLFPNQFVNARLLFNTLQNVIVLPEAAIQHGTQGEFVYLVDEENKAHIQAIKTGVADDGKVAVLEGLALGDAVVVSGFDKLRDGAKVTVADDAKPQLRADAKDRHAGAAINSNHPDKAQDARHLANAEQNNSR